MDRIARIDKNAFTGGLFLDQKQQSSPLWVDGSNVLFDAGRVQVFPGSVEIFPRTQSQLITGLAELGSITLGAPGICFGTKSHLYSWDSVNGAQTLGSGYTANVDQTVAVCATRWSIQQWNEYIVATNGKDPMQLCKVIGTGFADMTAATSTQFKYAEIIRKYRQFLLAFNLTLADGTTRQPTAAAWCDVNAVETWVPSSTNSAKKVFIPDIGDGIGCVEKLGEALFLYGGDTLYALNYAGYPDVFDPQFALSGIGVYGKNCVTENKGRHMGVGPRGVWVTDGTSYDYIDTPAVRKYFNANLNKDQASKIVVYYDHTIHHLMIFYPELMETENSAGLAYNDKEQKWTKLEFARTAAVDGGALNSGITGDLLGSIYRQTLQDVPSGNTANAFIPITSSIDIQLGYGQGGYGNYGYGGHILG